MSDLLLSFYADDFTGATDVMEALANAGVRTLVFLAPPAPDVLGGLSGIRATGVAGTTRALSPSLMRTVLSGAFERLSALDACMTHYKVCSTFDSSPARGSIGRAIEVGSETFGAKYVPVVVGSPRLGRYTAFGNLFARAGQDAAIHRLDRHPTMSRHPMTPMTESDLRMHLARQTKLRTGLVDLVDLELGETNVDRALARVISDGNTIVLLDVVTERHLSTVGRLLWRGASNGGRFVVGSSGVASALVAHWRTLDIVHGTGALPPARGASPVVVISGSASPVTDGQIGYALDRGFEEIALDVTRVTSRRPIARAVAALNAGTSVIVHTARGPDDVRLTGERRDPLQLGRALGRVLARILERVTLERIIIAGGDTSTAVVRELGVVALEAVASAAPGAPVCQVHAPGASVDRLELALKGGQMGSPSYLVDMRDGFYSLVDRKEEL